MNSLIRMIRHRRVRNRKPAVELSLEQFENRLLLSNFVVTNTLDSGPGSLAAAITAANGSPGSTIDFDIPTSDPGYHAATGTWTIQLTSSLPSITAQVTIDGTTQTGYAGQPLVEIVGNGAATTGLNLAAGSDGSTIEALDLTGFSAAAIAVGSNNNVISGNFVGPDISTLVGSSDYLGIFITGSNNTIGGTNAAAANVIGFSTAAGGVGVYIDSTLATGDLVEGNLIGTNAAGQNLGNVFGVYINDGLNDTIGGTIAGAANTIGFSSNSGIVVNSNQSTVIEGNFIGTNSAGANLGNAAGVEIGNSASFNTIGGTTASAANTIADNTGAAVQIFSGSGNSIRENLIYGNGAAIVLNSGANNNQVAPTVLAVASVPSLTTIDYSVTGTLGETYTVDFFASSSLGSPAAQYLGTTQVFLAHSSPQSFTSTFNLATALLSTQAVTATVTDSTGDTSQFAATAVTPASPFVVTNVTDGQQGSEVGSLRQAILDANNSPPSAGQTDDITFAIGGTGPFEISPFLSALPAITVPVTVDGTSQSVYAGTPIIELNGGSSIFGGLILGTGSNGSTITGLDIIAFNGGPAIQLESNFDMISGNVTGDGNAFGVEVDGALNTIGGTSSAAANVFGGSETLGVYVTGPDNLVEGNFIGTDAAGDNLANFIGMALDDVSNTIGGTIAAAANVVGFSSFAAIEVGAAAGSLIEGNFIGTDAAGQDLGNAQGVLISSSGITVGGTGAGNTIADNTGDAVQISSGSGDAIRQNLIYGNGSAIVVNSGANNNQAAPTILAVASVPNLTTIDYGVTGTLGQSYSVDFFASSSLGSPAAQYLGTTTVTLTSTTQAFTATFDLPTALLSTQAVTATATDSNGDTSQFAATAVTPASPFEVTNTTDGQQGSEVGSLRQAILDANNSPPSQGSTDNITFEIGTGPVVIYLGTAPPVITNPVLLDGSTQPGYAGIPIVIVDGGGLTIGGLILGAGSSGSTIKDLAIGGFLSNSIGGVEIDSNDNVISGDYIGTDATLQNLGNVGGVMIYGANNTIGGITSAAANTIGHNSAAGVQIIGSGATSNEVEGNFIGTDPAGDDLANAAAVQILNAGPNTIGGTAVGAGNAIGLNTNIGIAVVSGQNNVIRDNTYTGTNGTSTQPSVAVNDIGLGLGANNNQPAPILISASLSGGTLALLLTDNVTNVSNGSVVILDLYELSSSPVQRTFLGTVDSTTGAIPLGVSISVSGVSIGDQIVATATVAGNGTSAFSAPVTVTALTVVTNTNDSGPGSLRAAVVSAVSGETITFDITTGTAPYVIALASPVSITVPVTIDGTSQPGYVSAPIVELNGGGQSFDGVILGPGSGGSTIKGVDIDRFLGGDGVDIESNNNLISGNVIGTDDDDDHLGNNDGILISGADNTIGGTTSAAANVIGFNSSAGVSIAGASASGNLVIGNFIGTGAAGADLGNGLGVVIDGASDNTVGGTVTGAGNTIAFNGSDASHGALTVNAGTGNAILNNLFYGNTGSTIATSGIDLTNGGNDVVDLPAPVIAGLAPSGPEATTITLSVTGMAPGTYLLDVFASAAGDLLSSGQVDAHLLLATFQNVSISSGQTLLNETILESLNGGQQVTATWTVTGTAPANLTAGDTSEFAVMAAVVEPYVVTTTAPSGPGSLAYEIAAVNADTTNPNPDTIQFQLALDDSNYDPTTRVWTITPSNSLTITHPVIMDATLQSGYAGTPVVEIDGNLVAGAGLILATGSDGSRIRGLDIVDFGGAGLDIESGNNTIQSNDIGVLPDGVNAGANDRGILIDSSDNTIGGTAAGAGNVIAFNTVAGIDVASTTASGDTIRRNLIDQNGQNIVLASGANGGQQPPTLTAASSIVGSCTVQGKISGFAASTTYAVDFFASTAADPTGTTQAQVFLGSAAITTDANGDATINVTLGISVPSGQTITATATSPTGNTSELAAAITVINPFVVTNTSDNSTNPAIGSLREAILEANSNPSFSGTDTITFAIPGSAPYSISLMSSLTIDAPVTIDGASQSGYAGTPIIDLHSNGGSFDGLILAAGSSGSTIQDLDIGGFQGNGIDVESNDDIISGNFIGTNAAGANAADENGILISGANNTIGGTLASAANVIGFNTTAGVSIVSGTGNVVRENTYTGSNGSLTGPSWAADDIVVSPNASNPPAPVLGSTSLAAGQLSVFFTEAVPAGTVVSLDIYQYEVAANSTPIERRFLGTADATVTASGASVTITTPGIVSATQIVATLTEIQGTSAFSAPVSVIPPIEVTTTADNGNNLAPTPGSLRAEILAANATTGATITFDIPNNDIVDGTYTINLTAPLPQITAPMTIDGTSQPGFDPSTLAPVVEISDDGTPQGSDGLILGLGSHGSTIKGLDISGFGGAGAGILIESNDDVISGNFLGINPIGKVAGPGNGIGVLVDNASNNTIGGTGPGAGNTIAFNTVAGVEVDTGTGDAILENPIFSNGPSNSSSGIILNGANGGVSAPAISSVSSGEGTTTIITLITTGLPSGSVLDFFACEPDDTQHAYNQAQIFLGEFPLPSGNSVTLGATTLASNQYVTATITSPDGGYLGIRHPRRRLQQSLRHHECRYGGGLAATSD